MLTQLATVKDRLGLSPFEAKDDALLTSAIRGVSVRFEHECGRVFARTVNATEEFGADSTEIRVASYPIEQIVKFELKRGETEGWLEQPGINCLVRGGCVVSLSDALGASGEQGRVTYTGGFVLPGNPAEPGQVLLPADLEQAAIEQVAFWYQNRDKVGILRQWPKGGTYEQFADLDLLPQVRAVLASYQRWLA